MKRSYKLEKSRESFADIKPGAYKVLELQFHDTKYAYFIIARTENFAVILPPNFTAKGCHRSKKFVKRMNARIKCHPRLMVYERRGGHWIYIRFEKDKSSQASE